MGIYKFNSEDAERFAMQQMIQTRKKGKELEFVWCPYCKGGKGRDKATFSINLDNGQFECKRASCGMRGNMITLSRDFNFSLGRDVDAYYRNVDYSHKQYKEFKDAHRKIETRPRAVEYMAKRGISEDIVQKYELTNKPDNESILIFPFKDEKGTLTFIKYRNMDYVKGQGNKEWCEANCKPILFGMQHCDVNKDNGMLIITEGQIDSLSVNMAGYTNAVSVPTGCNGFTWIPYCYDFVNQFKMIIVMGDCENGKITLSEELSKRYPTKTRVCRQEDYKGCKDANELLNKYGISAIQYAIQNAEAPYCSYIKPLAKVEQIDIMKIPAISSGMIELNTILDGGFRLGQLAILTGKRGEGKSTLASMWIARALEHKFKCFSYSGELPDYMFRNWLDCQITGKYEHTQSEDDKLNNYYGDNIYIYDNTIVDENGDEFLSIMKVIEIAIIQRGCQFILLDNLMTALNDDLNADLYRSQSKFVGDLAAIAKKYNVFILLIAHPRKQANGYTQIGNDDISGSSHITDRADIVMTNGMPDKDEEDSDPTHRTLKVLKNRLTGKRGNVKLTYDERSRRLAESFDEFAHIQFSWNTDVYGFEDVTEDMVIPF